MREDGCHQTLQVCPFLTRKVHSYFHHMTSHLELTYTGYDKAILGGKLETGGGFGGETWL